MRKVLIIAGILFITCLLVMLTERRPYDAVVLTVRRLAFVWMPLSLLFIRYYPEFGRSYSWGGPKRRGMA